MQMDVYPRTNFIILSLGQAVRFIPVALCLMPKCLQRWAKPLGWRILIQRSLEFLRVHRLSADQ